MDLRPSRPNIPFLLRTPTKLTHTPFWWHSGSRPARRSSAGPPPASCAKENPPTPSADRPQAFPHPRPALATHVALGGRRTSRPGFRASGRRPSSPPTARPAWANRPAAARSSASPVGPPGEFAARLSTPLAKTAAGPTQGVPESPPPRGRFGSAARLGAWPPLIRGPPRSANPGLSHGTPRWDVAKRG